MKDLDLTTLRLFVAVCDARSIARVGERENTVPSARRVTEGLSPATKLLAEHLAAAAKNS